MQDVARDAVVTQFLLAYAEAQAAGEEVSLQEFQARYPGFEEIIEDAWRAILEGSASGTEDESLGVFGRYTLRKRLGRGGFATVFLADNPIGKGFVAVKILRELGAGPQQMQRLRREGELLASLDHRNICRVLDGGVVDGQAFIAMEYIPGRSLGDFLDDHRVKRRNQLAILDVTGTAKNDRDKIVGLLDFFTVVARALQRAHERGIVHRDVKPANIMIGGDGQPVLVDFGLGHEMDQAEDSLTERGSALGTRCYMAPEQIRGRSRDPKVDVWALGVTLFECLTGELPFLGADEHALNDAVLSREPAPIRTMVPSVSADLAVCVAAALRKEPDRRYATMRALADDLENVRANRPIAARPDRFWRHVWRWSQRNPGFASAAVVVLIAVVVLSYALFGRGVALAKVASANQRLESEYTRGYALAGATSAIDAHDFVGAQALLRDVDAAGAWPRSILASQLGGNLRKVRVHDCRVVAATSDAKARHLATLDDQGRVRVWNRDSLEMIAETTEGDGACRALLFRGGNKLVLPRRDGSFVIWSFLEGKTKVVPRPKTLRDGSVIVGLMPLREPDLAIAVAMDGGVAMVGSKREVARGIRRLRFEPFDGGIMASCLRVRPTGTIPLALGLAGGSVQVLNIAADRQQPIAFDRHRHGMVMSVDIDPTGRFMATGCRKGYLQLSDLSSNKRLWSVRAHRRTIYAIVFDAKGRIWTAGMDGAVGCWDRFGKRMVRRLGHDAGIEAMTMAGGRIYSMDHDGWMCEWAAEHTIQPGIDVAPAMGVRDNLLDGGRLLQAHITFGEGRIASAQGTAPPYEMVVADCVDSTVGAATKIPWIPLGFAASGEQIGYTERKHIFRVATDGGQTVLAEIDGGVISMDRSGDRLAFGLTGGNLVLIDGEVRRRLRPELLGELGDPATKLLDVRLSRDGSRLAIRALDGAGPGAPPPSKLLVLPFDGSTKGRLIDCTEVIASFEIDPDGASCWVGGKSGELRRFDLGTGDAWPVGLEGLRGLLVISIACHPTLPYVVLGLSNGTIGVWSKLSGRHVLDLANCFSSPYKMDFSSTGRYLFAETNEKEVFFWDAGPPVDGR